MTNLKKNYCDCLWEKYLSQTIKTFPKNCWFFEWLSQNSNITWEIVQANPDKPWRFLDLSENPNITWEIVQANPDQPWNYKKYFINHIGKQKFIEEQLKRAQLKRSVNVISDWFIDCKTNPDSNLCKKWMKKVQSEFYDKNPWEKK